MWKIIFAVLTVASLFIGVDCSGKAMKVTQAWTRATPADATTAEVYLTIQNRMGAPDTLLTATTYIAESAVIMTTARLDGAYRPEPVPYLPIDMDKDLTMTKDRTYILLEKLKQPLGTGEKFPITLTFAKGGDVLEDVIIRPAGTVPTPP